MLYLIVPVPHTAALYFSNHIHCASSPFPTKQYTVSKVTRLAASMISCRVTALICAGSFLRLLRMAGKGLGKIPVFQSAQGVRKRPVAVAKAHLCRFHFALVKIPLLYLIELAQDLFLRALHILYFHAALHQHNPLHAVVGRAAIIAQAQLFTHI